MKKLVSAFCAAITAAAAISTPVLSAKDYNASDLRTLGSSLLGNAPLKEEQDVNNDGKINSLDLSLIRKSFRSTGVFTDSSYPATKENVKFIGRNLFRDNVTWLIQSGSAIEFTVNAKSAEITLAGDSGIENGADLAPRYAVIVDDEIILDETMTEKEKTVSLFSGDSARLAKVKVIHLSEANNGAVGVSAIKVNSDVKAPVNPTPESDLRIEFIGDSITCGYGVEGETAYEGFKTTTENFMKSYAYRTAQKLGAEYSAVCYSGHGIISGYSNDGTINADSLVPPYYEQYSKKSDYSEKWDFESAPNDVVVINLGTNDSSYIKGDTERSETYAEQYAEFLKTVRSCNPDAYIICTLGTMGGEELYPYIQKAIEQFQSETGDERITSYLSTVQDFNADGVGSDWHPSAKTQQKSAYVLADQICQALGIESDQIGLDAAANAEYSINIDKESGANAATYFSDYDKSYWVNIVTGGTSPESVEILVSGISLKKDGQYHLSFSCTAPEGTEIPIAVTDSDGKTVYFSDTFKSNGEKTPFEADLTVPVSDPSAVFSMKIGGSDYLSYTLYGLRMEKTG